jgi:cytochrome c-type biogenesis protein CcmH/NrfF
MKLRIIVKDELRCPRCGAHEVANPDAPLDQQRLNIRGFKVFVNGDWRSQCLKCSEDTEQFPHGYWF